MSDDRSGDERMEIGFLASCYPRAVDTAVRNEVLGLRDRGHNVHTFSIRRADASQLVSELHHREHDSTTYIASDHLYETPRSAWRLLRRAPGRFLRALSLARRTRPPGIRGLALQSAYFMEACYLADEMLGRGVQHLHNHIGENSASVAMLASALSGIPYSLTIHGPYIFRAPERWALGEKIVRSTFTVAITSFTRSQCMMFVPASEWHRLHIVRCGPDIALLKAVPPARPADTDGGGRRHPRRLIWVGRICEEKGVPVLLEASERLAAEGLDFELVMVGEGPLRAMAEAQIRARGLVDRITITGWMNGDEVQEQIALSHVMVLPSFAEGLPAVIMEAMAFERPAISTYIAGIPELIEPGQNGWLVPAGSVDALFEAMREAVQAPESELDRLGRASREAVLRLHDTSAEVGKLEALIHASVSGTPSRATLGAD
jgi:colanic acid/amylovoran biosynthesis glycosyltransferase